MAEFIRPEARAGLLRWAETAIWVALTLFGAWLFLRGGLFWQAIGAIVAASGVALTVIAARNARFPQANDGPGVVEVDERQITYFGPTGGGAVSIDHLNRVEIETTDQGPVGSDLIWTFYMDGAAPLMIPGNATGADTLFDALAALQGVDYEKAISAAHSTQNARYTIWQKPHRQLH
jgi:hypothetical protein